MSNVELVQGLYAAFGQGDVDSILDGVTSDVDWEEVGRASDFPSFGPRHGREAVRDFFAALAREADFTEFSPLSFHASGDKVFVLGHTEMALKKNGRRVSTDWSMMFEFRDGKVCRFRDFWDTAQAAEAYKA